MTAYSAWNRLFDETIASLRFKVGGEVARHRADAQSAAGYEHETIARQPHRRWPRPSRKICASSRSSPMCWPRTRKFPIAGAALPMSPMRAIFPTASSPKWFRAGRGGARSLSAALAPLLCAQGELVRQEASAASGTATRRCPRSPAARLPGTRRSDTVLTAYGAFSPEMAAIAERFFNDDWIDAPVRPGKAPGAFAHPTVPSAHPYVLLNYQGKPRDVMTLAHELGHGVHQVLAAPNGALMAPTPLTLAETASVFGEMLTFRKLWQTPTSRQRKAMLAAKVEDMINTVVRQIAFYTFERNVHTERRKRRTHGGAAGRALARCSAREPRPRDRAQAGLRDVLGLYPALRAFAVLRLCLRLRRLPRELALRGLRACKRGLRQALSRHAGGGRHQAPFRAAGAVRTRRARPRFLAGRARRDRTHDRRSWKGWNESSSYDRPRSQSV